MSTLAIVIFIVVAQFTSWFVPWYHRRDPDAVVRYVPRIAASAAFLGILVLMVRQSARTWRINIEAMQVCSPEPHAELRREAAASPAQLSRWELRGQRSS